MAKNVIRSIATRSRISLVLGALIFLMTGAVVAGCGSGSEDTTQGTTASAPTTTPASGTPPKEPTGTITIGDVQGRRTSNWDAAASFGGFDMRIYSLVYEPLIEYNSQGKLVPALATSWKRIDPTTLRVDLRNGVKFQDGQPFTATDVKATLDRLGEKESAVPFASAFTTMHVKIIDPSTVDIVTDEPFGPLENALTVARIMSAKYLANEKLLEEKPNGTGPFEYVSSNNQHTVLRANPTYWHTGLPHIETIDYETIGDQTALTDALRSGEIQMMTQAAPAQIEEFEGNEDFYIPERQYYLPASYLYIYNENGPLKNVKVRQAIAYAVNRKEIAETILRGTQPESHSALPTTDSFYEPLEPSFEYDPEKAKALLKEAGYEPGQLKLRIPTSTAFAFGPEIDQAVASYLEAVGISVELDRVDPGTYSAGVYTKYDMSLNAWDEMTSDPDFTFAVFRQPLLGAIFGSTDEQMNELATDQRHVIGDARKAAVDKAAQYIWEQQPALFVSDVYAPEIVSKTVQNYTPTLAFGLVGLKESWLSE